MSTFPNLLNKDNIALINPLQCPEKGCALVIASAVSRSKAYHYLDTEEGGICWETNVADSLSER